MSTVLLYPGKAKALPLETLLATIPSLPRAFLERLVQQSIDHLDAIDGDTDVEWNGDELDSNNAEDDFAPPFFNTNAWTGAGCPISDPDYAVDDIACDPDAEGAL